MRYEILKLLKGSDGYISGEDISKQLGVSRSAVWKHINSLRGDGYEIKSVSNKGYKLISEPNLINPKLIEPFIRGKVYYTKETKSTNMLAKATKEAPDGSLFIAEMQTAGRGRLGRSWSSPAGDGIWMSFYLKPDISPMVVSQLTLVAGLAVSRAISGASIKWPNDILAGDKKICGILTEMSAEMDRVEQVIIGIGINVNNKNFPEDLVDKATSLYLEDGVEHKREDIIIRIAEEFNALYETFCKSGFSALKAEYEEKCATLGRTVKLTSKGEISLANAVCITDSGELIVEIDGKRTVVNSGEVSVRGLLSYN